jgi:glucosamine kinase
MSKIKKIDKINFVESFGYISSMSSGFLLADSGGSKTDWCFLDGNNAKEMYTTESFHPINWNEEFWQRMELFFSRRPNVKQASLRFFGAGCLNKDNADFLKSKFMHVGFTNVEVASDLHAAALACLCEKPGHIAIMGTGSVLFDWDGMEVKNIVGGKGHLEGDQGSAYYFGKLLLDAMRNNELAEHEKNILLNIIENQPFEDGGAQNDTKFHLANLAFLLRENKHDFERFHLKNMHEFYRSHIEGSFIKQLNLSGSYAFYHEDLLRKYFESQGIKIGIVIQRPIERMIDCNARIFD